MENPTKMIATASWHGDIALGNVATSPFAAGLHLSAAQPQPGFDMQGARSCDRAGRLFCSMTSARDASRTLGRDYAERLNDPVHFRYAAQGTEGGDQGRGDLAGRGCHADHADRLQDGQSRIGHHCHGGLLPGERLPAEHVVDGRENRRWHHLWSGSCLPGRDLATQERVENDLQYIGRILLTLRLSI